MTISQTQNNATDSAGTTVTAFGISYAITSILSAVLVVMKESNEAVHDGLAAITGHHWVTHGALNLIVFVVLGIVLSRTSVAQMSAKLLIATMIGATVVSGIIFAGYFI
jgi:hypothetical protein